MQTIKRKLWLALVMGAAVAATSVGAVDAFHTEKHPHNSAQSFAPLADVIAFVQLHGWSVDLAYLCKGLALTETNNKCLFQQIAIHTKTSELDDHGFNVPTDEFPPLHVVIYHVSPLAGEFFLASKDGRLIKAIYRARGTDFKPMSNERGNDAFKAELAFWQSNLIRIESDVSKNKSSAIPFLEKRR